MKFVCTGFIACMVLTSCTHNSPQATDAKEITDNPAVLYNRTVAPADMSLRGIKLGDRRTAIAASRIDREAQSGWIVCRDHCRYRVDDQGNVETLGVWDTRTLDQLNISDPDDITARFGPAQKTEEANPLQIFRYRDGHVSVLWNTVEKQVNAVNVSK